MSPNEQQMVELIKLCKGFLKESRYAQEELSIEKCTKIITNALNQPDIAYVKCHVDTDGTVLGFFLGYLERLFFNETVQARDLIFYVHPDHRNGKWIRNTIKEFEVWSKEKGAVYVELLHNTGINKENAIPMFEHLGYDHVGYVFNKEL